MHLSHEERARAYGPRLSGFQCGVAVGAVATVPSCVGLIGPARQRGRFGFDVLIRPATPDLHRGAGLVHLLMEKPIIFAHKLAGHL